MCTSFHLLLSPSKPSFTNPIPMDSIAFISPFNRVSNPFISFYFGSGLTKLHWAANYCSLVQNPSFFHPIIFNCFPSTFPFQSCGILISNHLFSLNHSQHLYSPKQSSVPSNRGNIEQQQPYLSLTDIPPPPHPLINHAFT